MPDDSKPDEEAISAGLEEVKNDVAEGREPTRSVRELLRWFGAQRRGVSVVERIEGELAAAGLRTDPHFTTTWIDAPIIFRKVEKPGNGAEQKAAGPKHEASEDGNRDAHFPDVAYLVRMLEAANQDVVSVNPDDPIETAITKMMANDFSQLAVMAKPRELNGAISWKSVGSRLSQRHNLRKVSDAMEKASEVLDTDTLFDATRKIIECDYVFVRSSADMKIIGIVTATDVSEQFQQLSEPFLLLQRIENQIRQLLHNRFDIETLRDSCDDNDPARKASITKVSQLTFGEYQRIFEKEENWKKLGFVACRITFVKELDAVREMRNEIMHFHPDIFEEGDFERLRRFSNFLAQLEKLRQ